MTIKALQLIGGGSHQPVRAMKFMTRDGIHVIASHGIWTMIGADVGHGLLLLDSSSLPEENIPVNNTSIFYATKWTMNFCPCTWDGKEMAGFLTRC